SLQTEEKLVRHTEQPLQHRHLRARYRDLETATGWRIRIELSILIACKQTGSADLKLHAPISISEPLIETHPRLPAQSKRFPAQHQVVRISRQRQCRGTTRPKGQLGRRFAILQAIYPSLPGQAVARTSISTTAQAEQVTPLGMLGRIACGQSAFIQPGQGQSCPIGPFLEDKVYIFHKNSPFWPFFELNVNYQAVLLNMHIP